MVKISRSATSLFFIDMRALSCHNAYIVYKKGVIAIDRHFEQRRRNIRRARIPYFILGGVFTLITPFCGIAMALLGFFWGSFSFGASILVGTLASLLSLSVIIFSAAKISQLEGELNACSEIIRDQQEFDRLYLRNSCFED
jgi:hypothetical protein